MLIPIQLKFQLYLKNQVSPSISKKGFSEKVLNKIFLTSVRVNREVEFVRSMTFAFNRIALTGIAAIILLLISIFLMEGTISFNSFLGLSNSYDESIVSMLTGN